MLTIQAFSKSTGIPKSTLRYYEEVGLLIPKRQAENGYRLYDQSQIEPATLIASLRLANVPIKEIQSYLSADDQEKLKLRKKWINQLNRQKELIDIQLKYLENYRASEEIYLFEKDRERILWFTAEEKQGNFKQQFLKGQNILDKHNIQGNNNWYLKYISGRKTVRALIGFSISEKADISGIEQFETEEILNESLCVALSFKGEFSKIEKAYMRLARYINDNHYTPAGSVMEMYRGKNLNEVTVFIPVIKLGGSADV